MMPSKWTETQIEAELRLLPKPVVPSGLEKRLLDMTLETEVLSHRSSRRRYAGVLIAACLAITVGTSLYWYGRVTSSITRDAAQTSLSADEGVRLALQRETTAARLTAAAGILAEQPAGRDIANETYKYIAKAYSDTSPGKKILGLMEKQE